MDELDTSAGVKQSYEMSVIPQCMEWKMTLCYVPPNVSYGDVETLFKPLLLKHITRSFYSDCWILEVSFWNKDDIQTAIEDYSNKFNPSMEFRPTLKLPSETTTETKLTKLYLHTLPFYLLDDILYLIAPFRKGKVLSRVCKAWKISLDKAQRTHPDVLMGSEDEMARLVSGPLKMPSSINHAVLMSTDHLPNPHSMCPNHRYHLNMQKLCSEKGHIRHLTFHKALLVKAENLFFSRTRHMKTYTCMDSFIRFKFTIDFSSYWALAVYVPWLKLESSAFPASGVGPNAGSADLRLIMLLVDSMNLWWPYGPEQDEWLQTCLQLLDDQTRQVVEGYLRNRNHYDFRQAHQVVPVLDVTPSNVTFGRQRLDKRDCAFIGHYISSLNLPDISSPPVLWRNTFFLTLFLVDDINEKHRPALLEVRRRAWEPRTQWA